MDNKLHGRGSFIIVSIGILLISAEILAFRSLNHSMDGFARGMGTVFQRATVVVDAASKLTPQGLATTTSVTDLSKYPRKFDGSLVQVRAWLAFGWEGDNFLFDSREPEPQKDHSPHVWFYSKPYHVGKVWETIQVGGAPVLGTFRGYFHFVPDQKSRMKDVFDPGPLQLEVIEVFDLAPNAKPNTSGPATPRN